MLIAILHRAQDESLRLHTGPFVSRDKDRGKAVTNQGEKNEYTTCETNNY